MPNVQANPVLDYVRNVASLNLSDRELAERFRSRRDEASFAMLVRRKPAATSRILRSLLLPQTKSRSAPVFLPARAVLAGAKRCE
jgi:hypothetical protein